jgi:hypothetical protein
MAARPYIREDMADIRVWLDGIPYGESWKECVGGNLEADVAKARPGGMGYEMSAGGPASRQDLTVRTNMTDIVAGWHPTFENRVGIGEIDVQLTWMNRDRTLTQIKSNRKGILQAANLPDAGTAGADVGLYEIVVDMDELGS